MRVLITGSRDWRNYGTIYGALAALSGVRESITVVHGAATGADHMAHSAALALGYAVEPHFPDYDKYRSHDAPLRRNQEMVEAGADLCLAFPMANSRGTYHCAKLAKGAGIPVEWYGPMAPPTES